MKEFDDKIGIKLVVLIFLIPTLVSLALWFPYKILPVGDTNGWLGFFGSYLGSILGFYAAYKIAKAEFEIANQQIEDAKREKYEESKLQQYPYLYSLKIDISEMKDDLISLNKKIKEKDLNKIISIIENINYEYEKYYKNISATINILLVKIHKSYSIIYQDFKDKVNSYEKLKGIVNLYDDNISVEDLVSNNSLQKIVMKLLVSLKIENTKKQETNLDSIDKLDKDDIISETEEKLIDVISSYNEILNFIFSLCDNIIVEIDKELEKAESIIEQRESIK